MARTLAPRPPGARITNYSSLGVVAPWWSTTSWRRRSTGRSATARGGSTRVQRCHVSAAQQLTGWLVVIPSHKLTSHVVPAPAGSVSV